jgi:hypothetical protein
MEDREVVKYSEGPALGRQNQVAMPDLDVGNRHRGQVELEGLPDLPVVERNVDAELYARVEQTWAVRILANYPGRFVEAGEMATFERPKS